MSDDALDAARRIEQEVAAEFNLVKELGEWYLDAAIFGQHRRFNKIVTALIQAKVDAAIIREQTPRPEPLKEPTDNDLDYNCPIHGLETTCKCPTSGYGDALKRWQDTQKLARAESVETSLDQARELLRDLVNLRRDDDECKDLWAIQKRAEVFLAVPSQPPKLEFSWATENAAKRKGSAAVPSEEKKS